MIKLEKNLRLKLLTVFFLIALYIYLINGFFFETVSHYVAKLAWNL
jgi:hypothetical protein